MKRILSLTILFCLLTGAVNALEYFESKNQGDLSASVFITDSPKFLKEWLGTPATHAPTIKRISQATRGQQFHVGVIVSGYAVSNDSKVNFEVALKVQDPSGRVVFEDDKWASHVKKVEAVKGNILVDPLLDMMVEAGDPVGYYTISASVKDRLSGKHVQQNTKVLIQ